MATYNSDISKDIIDKLEHEIDDLIDQKIELEKCLKAELVKHVNKLLDADVTIMNQEEHIQSVKSCLDVAQLKASKLETQLQALEEEALMKTTILEGEIEKYRTEADKVPALELKVDRLRDKVEELSVVREQFKEEVCAHNDTQIRLLTLETEVAGLRKFKAQVEVYRAQCAESAVLLEELRNTLQVTETKLAQMTASNALLESSRKTQQEEQGRLRLELAQESGPAREEAVFMIDEMNPQVRYELEKLRSDNERMAAAIDESAVEAVEALQTRWQDQASHSTYYSSLMLMCAHPIVCCSVGISKHCLAAEVVRSFSAA